jgi:hypothetical protein
MALHPPPCGADEVLWGNLCYPKIDAIRIEKAGGNFNFILGGVSSELLTKLKESAGDQGRLLSNQTGKGFDVTIESVPPAAAADLLKQLRPSDPKLPE